MGTIAKQIIDDRGVRSKAIEILRFPLALMVVAVHCYYFNTQNINVLQSEYGSIIVKWIINICSIVLTDCAVPMFYVISGYLFFIKQDSYTWTEYKNKILKKCRTLLLPYLIWNIIAIIVYPEQFFNVSVIEKILGFWSRRVEWGSWSGPWNGPLWFIRDLFVVMIFSPIISKLIKHIGVWLVILLFIPYAMGFKGICPGLSSVAFLFFCCGSFLAIKKSVCVNNISIPILTIAAILLFICRILIVGNIINSGKEIVTIIWIFISMIFYYRIACWIAIHNSKKKWQALGSSSFVIFTMHSLINGRISSTFLFFVGKNNVGDLTCILFYFATIILTVIICYGFHTLVKRNNITALLFEGGRKR